MNGDPPEMGVRPILWVLTHRLRNTGVGNLFRLDVGWRLSPKDLSKYKAELCFFSIECPDRQVWVKTSACSCTHVLHSIQSSCRLYGAIRRLIYPNQKGFIYRQHAFCNVRCLINLIQLTHSTKYPLPVQTFFFDRGNYNVLFHSFEFFCSEDMLLKYGGRVTFLSDNRLSDSYLFSFQRLPLVASFSSSKSLAPNICS